MNIYIIKTVIVRDDNQGLTGLEGAFKSLVEAQKYLLGSGYIADTHSEQNDKYSKRFGEDIQKARIIKFQIQQ